MTIKNVVVAGGGVLGSQIAYQAAYKGFAVTVWLRSEGSVERAKPKFEQLRQTYLATLEAMKSDPAAYCRGLADTPELSVDEIEQLKQRAQQAFESIVFTTSYEAAAKDADLVIEAIAEDPKQKDAFYAELAKYLPESTILVTNALPISTPPRCCLARSRHPRVAPRSSWRCISPIASGATTLPRSWGIPEPIRLLTTRWFASPLIWAWFRCSCTRSSLAIS